MAKINKKIKNKQRILQWKRAEKWREKREKVGWNFFKDLSKFCTYVQTKMKSKQINHEKN